MSKEQIKNIAEIKRQKVKDAILSGKSFAQIEQMGVKLRFTSADIQQLINEVEAEKKSADKVVTPAIETKIEVKASVPVVETKIVTPEPKAEKEKEIEESKKIDEKKAEIEKAYEVKEKTLEDHFEERVKLSGLSGADFAAIPEWASLKTGQKFLVLEQAEQEILRHVKERGEKRFKENNTLSIKTDSIGTSLKKVRNNIIKSVWISKEEKSALNDAIEGNIKPDIKKISQLVKQTKEMDLDIILRKSGDTVATEIQF